jgi:hypothetical protein
MATSFSFETPAPSISTADFSINRTQDDENPSRSSCQTSFHSLAESSAKRDRTNLMQLQTMTTDNNTITRSNHDGIFVEDDPLLTSDYDRNRSKQQNLLLITNIFRLLIILILAPIIYFLV